MFRALLDAGSGLFDLRAGQLIVFTRGAVPVAGPDTRRALLVALQTLLVGPLIVARVTFTLTPVTLSHVDTLRAGRVGLRRKEFRGDIWG